MRVKTLLFSATLFAASFASAQEKIPMLQVNGETFSNVTVVDVTATDLYFTSDRGIGNAKLKNLDPEMQKHFHFNSSRAGDAQKKQEANNASYDRQLASSAKPLSLPAPEKEDSGKQIWAKSFLNQRAPELLVEHWLTPQPDCRGKFVLIDFWATWCGPCRRAIPELNALQQKFANKLMVIGLSDEPEQTIRAMTEPKIGYAIASDTQKRSSTAAAVKGIPHCLLIDPQGIVRWEGFPLLGGHELTEAVVGRIIEKYSP